MSESILSFEETINRDAINAAESITTTVTGLEQISMGAARIQVDDKKIINCRAD